jgi:hypothetical protein
LLLREPISLPLDRGSIRWRSAETEGFLMFVSDNVTEVFPQVMQAIVDANIGDAISYGTMMHRTSSTALFRSILRNR